MTIKLRQTVLLLPGHELDGFPRSLDSESAAELLAGWVALWHPCFLRVMRSAPHWLQADQLPSDPSGTLAILPSISKADLNPEFRSGHERQEILLVEPSAQWQKLQHELLEATDLAAQVADDASILEELVPTFAALGYAYLQIQLMTRQLRYTSNLDTSLFGEQLVQAAEATLNGDLDQATQMLQSCFDCLGQERDHYYSLDVSLLDVTLLADSTLGKSLSRQLASPRATSYLASGNLLRQLAVNRPDDFGQLKSQIENSQVCILGGLDRERPHPLMSREALGRDLQRGRACYRELGLESPRVFARLSFGLAADHPAALKRHGFDGAMLIPWTGGTYPEGSQAKMSWEASDGTYLPAVATRVLDAADPASFLSLGWETGDALDHQHVPTLVFAHWPDHACDFFELLQIVSRHTPALGKWTTAQRYFEQTDQPYHQERLNAASFHFDWLETNASALMHATKQFHLLQARCRSLQNLANLAWQLEQPCRPQGRSDEKPDEPKIASCIVPSQADWYAELQQLHEVVDSLLDEPEKTDSQVTQAKALADALSGSVIARLSKVLRRRSKADEESQPVTGRISLNPQSCPVRMRVQSDRDRQYAQADWNFASGRVGDDRITCIDVPSMGFVVAPYASDTRPATSKELQLAQVGGLIRNEFLEAQIDVGRGHLRTLHVPDRRGNRLSMMVARRDQGTNGKVTYSEMVASDVRMLTSSNVCGVVRSTGRLEFAGKRVADFEIDYEAWRGSRTLEVVIRLSRMARLIDRNPWRSAYVIRLAWPTEAAIVRSHHLGWRHSWPDGKCVSPTLIEIDETDYRTHYLTGGLAFHRRTETRFLETILSVGEESAEHRVGLAVDLPYPQSLARDFLDTRYSQSIADGKLEAAHGWLVSADVKNVVVDLESPLLDDQGRNVGMRLYLSECQGKSTSTTVRLMHPVASANRVNVAGESIGRLTAKKDSFTIALRSNEQCLVDVLWGADVSKS